MTLDRDLARICLYLTHLSKAVTELNHAKGWEIGSALFYQRTCSHMTEAHAQERYRLQLQNCNELPDLQSRLGCSVVMSVRNCPVYISWGGKTCLLWMVPFPRHVIIWEWRQQSGCRNACINLFLLLKYAWMPYDQLCRCSDRQQKETFTVGLAWA